MDNERKEFMREVTKRVGWDKKTDEELEEALRSRWTQLGLPFNDDAIATAIKFVREELS